ncbi:ER-bound oxygenase [Fulvia fulva]|uniref:ER-bound oxygenase n=1 Tax=Passalora fulva TaxID=5499 RepID=A0A9Q8L5U9_PASFU|nr:ER-bound oxygenase [Fulvia fulva]KAK4634369.1 ER-bound oxygenase [Fulvia fulva]KAK4638269.1 ER-bound oxygenase [Fulvia fulva]UJO11352.1 ER-bound oxygenase [Fulvia fulva]WPV09604.1 ER-bound oxygenase [Fulvia fulva]WPV23798.1 ER-bound oxygenase [Fulvia fulva]
MHDKHFNTRSSPSRLQHSAPTDTSSNAMLTSSVSPALAVTALIAYIGLVRALRYRRRDALRIKYPDRASLAAMTLDEAFRIQSDLSTLEKPAMYLTALSFALFKIYRAHPWYIEPTLLSRWGPSTWIRRATGGALPGDQGDKYHPKGYVISEVGPQNLLGKGEQYMAAARENILLKGAMRCPFGR